MAVAEGFETYFRAPPSRFESLYLEEFINLDHPSYM